MADLIVCVENIRTFWEKYNYHLIIVNNGKANGFEIPEIVKKATDCVIERFK
jgi:hypothetical protein